MASPFLFNDPYDCCGNVQLNPIKESELIKIKTQFFDLDSNPQLASELNNLEKKDLIKQLEAIAKNTLTQFVEKFLNSVGVCCFSETNKDLLMWGHYSDSYQGFCLEFNTDYELFSKLHKVKYPKVPPNIDTSELFTNEQYPLVPELYCTKSIEWSHEKEWRILHNKAGTLYKYEPKCLKAIYFGPRIDRAFLEILCLILWGQNPDVELYQGILSENEFSLHFNPITYTPYRVGKELGLH